MKKLLIVFSILFSFTLSTNANEINRYIHQTDFELQSTVGVYIQNENTNHVLYKKNEQKLLNPASTLKTITFGISYFILGENYKFETALYKDNSNNIYVKLGADTLLSQADLNNLFKQFKTKFNTEKINNIYIDDTIFDKNQYPISWMEEDVWPYARGITPYIIDKNLTDILIKRSSLATKVEIIQDDDYKIPAINELKLADKESNIQDIKLVKVWGEDKNIVNFQGTISKDEILKLPVLRADINFNIKLKKAIAKNGINFSKTISAKQTPLNAVKIASVYHTIEEISKDILYNSDNFASEVVSKVAAAKYINYSHPATFEDEINMFTSYFNQLPEGIKIADSSGVSRYNLVTCEFLTNAINDLFHKTNLKTLMATPPVGTLKDRLLFLKDNLKAKTGTLSKMSAITGGLTTEKGNDVVFSIIIQNSPKRKAILKNFENTVVGIIYKKY